MRQKNTSQELNFKKTVIQHIQLQEKTDGLMIIHGLKRNQKVIIGIEKPVMPKQRNIVQETNLELNQVVHTRLR